MGAIRGAAAKLACLIVDVVEKVTVLCATGRRLACDGMGTEGESISGEAGAPSNGDGDAEAFKLVVDSFGREFASSSSAGVTPLDGEGEAGGVPSLLPSCLTGDGGLPKLLVGRAKGVDGRSPD